MAQRTLIIIKPDAIQRHLSGEIITRFERKGFKLLAAKFMQISQDLARRHYAVHKGKSFFEPLVKYLSSSPALILVFEAEHAVETARKMVGATFGYEAEPGTIRGDLSCSARYNLVHASDSPEAAEQEIKLFFGTDEIVDYKLTDAKWLYAKSD